ncbi:MAG: YbaY family lipoprotein [Vitreimonas sp.]
MLRSLAMLIGMFALSACAPDAPPAAPEAAAAEVAYSGEVIYLERIALPPGAQVRVELQDVSRADAPARTIATQTIDASAGGPPFAFTLTAPRAEVEAAAELAIRAIIVAEDRLLFTTDTRIPAPKQGASGIEVRVIGVSPR